MPLSLKSCTSARLSSWLARPWNSRASARTVGSSLYGTILFGGYAQDGLLGTAATVKLTLGPNLTINGAAGKIDTGAAPFDNQGKIIADPSATGPNPVQTTINLSGTGWTNHGTLGAQNGGTLSLAGSWSNLGTVNDNLSTVNLGGSFTTAGLGTFTGTFTASAGAINLTGALDNTAAGAVLRVGAAPLPGNWSLDGGTITGGTVQAATGSALVVVATSKVIGVTLDGTGAGNSTSPLSMQTQGATLKVSGALTLKGATLTLGNAAATFQDQVLFIDSSPQTVDGVAGSPGTILLPGYLQDGLFTTTNSVKLTLGSNLTVTGAGGRIDTGGVPFDNQGKIIADPSASAANPFTINLLLNGTNWTNHGTLGAQNGGLLTLAGSWSNLGTVNDNLSTVNLGGSFTTAGLGTFTGTFSPTAGAINIVGTLDNTAVGAVLRVGAAPLAGNWFLSGGTISGGTVQAANGNALVVNANSKVIGVTLDGTGAGNSVSPLDMTTKNSTLNHPQRLRQPDSQGSYPDSGRRRRRFRGYPVLRGRHRADHGRRRRQTGDYRPPRRRQRRLVRQRRHGEIDARHQSDDHRGGWHDQYQHAAEVAGWIKVLPQLGRQGVALGFLQSTELRASVFAGYYDDLLHRTASGAEVLGWLNTGLDFSTVRVDFESGSEFFSNG
jgi:hypothetical protein